MPSHYAILGLQRECTEAELKKQYRLLALKYHPDRNRGGEADAAEKFKQLREAYTVLSDSETRQEYDLELDASRSHRWKQYERPVPTAPTTTSMRSWETSSEAAHQREQMRREAVAREKARRARMEQVKAEAAAARERQQMREARETLRRAQCEQARVEARARTAAGEERGSCEDSCEERGSGGERSADQAPSVNHERSAHSEAPSSALPPVHSEAAGMYRRRRRKVPTEVPSTDPPPSAEPVSESPPSAEPVSESPPSAEPVSEPPRSAGVGEVGEWEGFEQALEASRYEALRHRAQKHAADAEVQEAERAVHAAEAAEAARELEEIDEAVRLVDEALAREAEEAE